MEQFSEKMTKEEFIRMMEEKGFHFSDAEKQKSPVKQAASTFIDGLLNKIEFKNQTLNNSKTFKYVALGIYAAFLIVVPALLYMFNPAIGITYIIGFFTLIILENL